MIARPFCQIVVAATALLAVVSPLCSEAEFRCATELSYKWQKNEEEELETLFAQLERSGETEEAARKTLEEVVFPQKLKAAEECKREHENLASCIAAKFSAMDSVLKRLGFSARKELEQAISADCKNNLGICLAVIASEIKCREVIEVEEEGEGEEEEEEEKGRKGKKKR